MTETERCGIDDGGLPYAVDDEGHVLVAAGPDVYDLSRLGGLEVGPDIWTAGALNPFMALGPDAWRRTRAQLADSIAAAPPEARRPRGEVRLRPPFEVADYVDFYASEAHATRMGRILRPNGDALPPAWRHLPIGYHGRAASVIMSGSPIYRPSGLVAGSAEPQYRPTSRLDFEVELGFVIGVGSARGRPIAIGRAAEHVFGVVLVNDWSARDIQAFEYQPLGPFLGKSFATSISPWVMPLAALEAWRRDGPVQVPEPVPHLRVHEPWALDIDFAVQLNGTVVSRVSSRQLYWTMPQLLAHLSANGAPTRTGDLFASGTISEWDDDRAGSLMELTGGGERPIALDDGQKRTWLEDGDEVIIRAHCGTVDGAPLDLGEVAGTVLPGERGVDP